MLRKMLMLRWRVDYAARFSLRRCRVIYAAAAIDAADAFSTLIRRAPRCFQPDADLWLRDCRFHADYMRDMLSR